jgi:hypothetical protein
MSLLFKKIESLFKPTARPSLYLYLSLRLLQFGATTLTLTYFCSLIGWHNGHYCSKRFYKDQCYPYQQDYARVPTLYIIFVTTVSNPPSLLNDLTSVALSNYPLSLFS